MIIYIDSREQRKLEFKNIETVVKKLDFGDYACEDIMFVFERKALGDLYGTMGKGHKRFKKELQRAIDNNYKIYVIIEGTYTKVRKGYKHSQLRPATLFKIMGTMLHKYPANFEVLFCKDREEMAQEIAWRFSGE